MAIVGDCRNAITKKKGVFCYIFHYVLKSQYYRGEVFFKKDRKRQIVFFKKYNSGFPVIFLLFLNYELRVGGKLKNGPKYGP